MKQQFNMKEFCVRTRYLESINGVQRKKTGLCLTRHQEFL